MSTEQPAAEHAAEPKAPFLRVVRGDASAEEVAALVAVLASLQVEAPAAPKRSPEWAHPRRAQRVTYRRGPGGWRASGLPG